MKQTAATRTETCKVVPSKVPVPTGPDTFSIEHLTTHELRSLGSLHGTQCVSSLSRTSLLTMAERSARVTNGVSWEVHDSKGVFPDRVNAGLVSDNKDLYLFGGEPYSSIYVQELMDMLYYSYEEPFMMKLDSHTNAWEPVSLKGAPVECWSSKHSKARGAVHDGRFFLISPDDYHNPDDMRVYDFNQQEWALWQFPIRPPAADNVLLGVHEGHLIQYGGWSLLPHLDTLCASHCLPSLQTWSYKAVACLARENYLRQDIHTDKYDKDMEMHAGYAGWWTWVDAANALWTFDIKQRAWQHRLSTGCLPEPALCCALAVVKHHAYVLVDVHKDAGSEPVDLDCRMDVYMLDLQTWHWERLPSQTDAPVHIKDAAPAVVEVREDHQAPEHVANSMTRIFHYKKT